MLSSVPSLHGIMYMSPSTDEGRYDQRNDTSSSTALITSTASPSHNEVLTTSSSPPPSCSPFLLFDPEDASPCTPAAKAETYQRSLLFHSSNKSNNDYSIINVPSLQPTTTTTTTTYVDKTPNNNSSWLHYSTTSCIPPSSSQHDQKSESPPTTDGIVYDSPHKLDFITHITPHDTSFIKNGFIRNILPNKTIRHYDPLIQPNISTEQQHRVVEKESSSLLNNTHQNQHSFFSPEENNKSSSLSIIIQSNLPCKKDITPLLQTHNKMSTNETNTANNNDLNLKEQQRLWRFSNDEECLSDSYPQKNFVTLLTEYLKYITTSHRQTHSYDIQQQSSHCSLLNDLTLLHRSNTTDVCTFNSPNLFKHSNKEYEKMVFFGPPSSPTLPFTSSSSPTIASTTTTTVSNSISGSNPLSPTLPLFISRSNTDQNIHLQQPCISYPTSTTDPSNCNTEVTTPFHRDNRYDIPHLKRIAEALSIDIQKEQHYPFLQRKTEDLSSFVEQQQHSHHDEEEEEEEEEHESNSSNDTIKRKCLYHSTSHSHLISSKHHQRDNSKRIMEKNQDIIVPHSPISQCSEPTLAFVSETPKPLLYEECRRFQQENILDSHNIIKNKTSFLRQELFSLELRDTVLLWLSYVPYKFFTSEKILTIWETFLPQGMRLLGLLPGSEPNEGLLLLENLSSTLALIRSAKSRQLGFFDRVVSNDTSFDFLHHPQYQVLFNTNNEAIGLGILNNKTVLSSSHHPSSTTTSSFFSSRGITSQSIVDHNSNLLSAPIGQGTLTETLRLLVLHPEISPLMNKSYFYSQQNLNRPNSSSSLSNLLNYKDNTYNFISKTTLNNEIPLSLSNSNHHRSHLFWCCICKVQIKNLKTTWHHLNQRSHENQWRLKIEHLIDLINKAHPDIFQTLLLPSSSSSYCYDLSTTSSSPLTTAEAASFERCQIDDTKYFPLDSFDNKSYYHLHSTLNESNYDNKLLDNNNNNSPIPQSPSLLSCNSSNLNPEAAPFIPRTSLLIKKKDSERYDDKESMKSIKSNNFIPIHNNNHNIQNIISVNEDNNNHYRSISLLRKDSKHENLCDTTTIPTTTTTFPIPLSSCDSPLDSLLFGGLSRGQAFFNTNNS